MATMTPAEADRKKTRKKGGVGGWFRSFSGILASTATIVAALAGAFAAHQTSKVDQLNLTIKDKNIVINQVSSQLASVKASAAANPSPSTSTSAPSTSISGGAPVAGGAYLSALQPTVDNAGFQTGLQIMSAVNYPNSVTFYCYGSQNNGQPDEAFNVAGHTLFKAIVGIPDNASNATSLDETVTFTNQAGAQLGKPVTVSLGKAATVQLNITGVTQLGMTCSGTNAQTQQPDNNNVVTLGNAAIS
jgi:hypothetical protein